MVGVIDPWMSELAQVNKNNSFEHEFKVSVLKWVYFKIIVCEENIK